MSAVYGLIAVHPRATSLYDELSTHNQKESVEERISELSCQAIFEKRWKSSAPQFYQVVCRYEIIDSACTIMTYNFIGNLATESSKIMLFLNF